MKNLLVLKNNLTVLLSFLLLLTVGCDWFEDDSGEVLPSENNSLVSLFVSEGNLSPNFNVDTNGYLVEVGSNVESIQVTATTADDLATIQINNVDTVSGGASAPISLAVGANIIQVVVTAENGDANGIEITVTRAAPVVLSNNANLSDLVVSISEFSPIFSPSITAYTLSLANEIESLTVKPASDDANATIRVNGETVVSGQHSNAIALNVGENVTNIEVTAEDGTTTKAYSITIARADPVVLSDNADLSDLSLSVGELGPVFTSATITYNVSVNNATEVIAVTPTSDDVNATIQVNGIAVDSGTSSDVISLSVGETVINIVVTAEDGAANKTYTVNVTRDQPLSDNADLSSLSLSVGSLSPDFSATVTSYSASVDFSTESIRVTPTLSDNNASVTVDGIVTGSAEASDDINLVEGGNSIILIVLAQDGVTVKNYSITVNRQSAASFAQQTYIKASNTGADDLFGFSVAYYDNTLAVSSIGEDSNATGVNGNQTNNSIATAGAVYVFTRDDSGVWSQQAYLKASNPGSNDQFGVSLALYKDTLAVGARFEDSDSTGVNGSQLEGSLDSGAVYIYNRDENGIWSQQAYVKSFNDTNSVDHFGTSVTLGENTLAVGAWLEDSSATGINGDQDNNSASNSGAVYVYIRDDSNVWTEQAYIKASNSDEGDTFGAVVALSGDTLVVGAQGEASSATGINGDQSDNSLTNVGAVYVYVRDETGNWSQQAYLKASNAGDRDQFGRNLAFHGDTLAVGAVYEDSNATGVDGDQTDNSIDTSGAIYVFTRDGSGTWSQQAYIKASNPGEDDSFGFSLSVSADKLAVGAYHEGSNATGIDGDQSNDDAEISGAVYLFERDNLGVWSQRAYIKASNTDIDDHLGYDVALGNELLIVGAHSEDSNAVGIDGIQGNNSASRAGAVYIFGNN